MVACARVRACTYVYVCVRAGVPVCVCACVRVRLCARVRAHVHVVALLQPHNNKFFMTFSPIYCSMSYSQLLVGLLWGL